MPLTNISLRQGTSPEYKQAVADGINRAMLDALALAPDDRFQLIYEHTTESMLQDPTFFGIERSERSLFVQIFINPRPLAQKQALYAAIVENLVREPGVRQEDIFIGLVETSPENWWAYAREVDESGFDARAGGPAAAGAT